MPEWFIPFLLSVVTASTPFVFAGIGELVVEKSGVLNLGVEGMMIVGAVSAFAVGVTTGSGALAVLTGAFAGAAMALIFGVLTLYLLSNQVATGLALTLFGLGLSALMGHGMVGKTFPGLPHLEFPLLEQIPVIGPLIGTLLLGHDVLVYFSVALMIAVGWFLNKSRAGMVLRAVGENHTAAHSIGYPVNLVRLLAVLFGGAMAGLGGAYLSLVHTPLWVENMTAGRGWIALALVVFASWRPARVFVGAYLFGGLTIMQLHAQGLGIEIPPQVLAMAPYLATILVLVIISRDSALIRLNAPACLGKSFHATG